MTYKSIIYKQSIKTRLFSGTIFFSIFICLFFISCSNKNDDPVLESNNTNNTPIATATTTISPDIDAVENPKDSTYTNVVIEEPTDYTPPVITDKNAEDDSTENNEVTKIEKTEDDILEYILPYYQKNNETIGYIKIADTPIDYPVLQAEDNFYYLHYDFNHNKSSKGCIFLDYKCDFQDFSATKNNILYGHRMKDGTMFKGIVNYFDQSFYDTHKIISFDTLYGKYQWEVFSVFETHIRFNYINTDFQTDEMWVDFLNECNEKSIYKNDIQFEPDDIVLTLSTCAIDDMRRCVVMTRLISQSNDTSSTLVGDVLIPSDDEIDINEDE